MVDTAGRLHIDDELMNELERSKPRRSRSEMLFVADAMTGQDADQEAGEFHRRIGITGVVLTQDGRRCPRRRGACRSSAVIGQPVKFVGVGERLQDLEPFYPDRVVSRVLGMGDVLSLIEKAERSIQEEAGKARAKIRQDEFTLEDFRDQLQTIKKMGPLEQILGMLPGMGNLKELTANREQVDDKQLGRVEAIINSMTPKERRNHQLINGSRRKRIAKGSGTSVEEVNRLLEAVRADEEDAEAARRYGRAREEARRAGDDEVDDESDDARLKLHAVRAPSFSSASPTREFRC